MSTFHKVLITPNKTIMDALRIIDTGSKQIALVVSEDHVLLGTVTDGDIRRGLLRGESLYSLVTTVMNGNPVVAKSIDSRQTIFSLMRLHNLRQVPIIDKNGKVVRMELLESYIEKRSHSNPVVLMAGGLGTRLRPLTDNCPKPLLKVGKKPILEIILENFIECGFYRFYFTVNYKAEMIKDYFGDGSRWGVDIKYIDETERMGTAGSLSLLADFGLSEPLFVMNGDLLTKVNFHQLLDYHKETKALATMCVRDFDYQVPYGVIRTNGHTLIAIEEKPIQRFYVNAGIYLLEPRTLEMIPKKAFYDMPTLFEQIIASHYEASVFPIREYWLDIGRMDDFNRANGEYMENFE
ncbi:UTP--glucose-1-phosphate uridylyltransferase [Paenibacillus plantiphilus]|uniref:UTP--glucose-1-phosphate uridylyltransferase n=1 Tax=Paenibacillus plantiphilus TaxID=2905650 RepID=A0ABN8G0G3_9BACL|nr:nucleotidyltransferase family protein [Paenibacillus plantiphilus]CAH1192892.1 UTP--glucose-1-phosphate uridylyltransferase [Paenibacillus plantiphilus]